MCENNFGIFRGEHYYFRGEKKVNKPFQKLLFTELFRIKNYWILLSLFDVYVSCKSVSNAFPIATLHNYSRFPCCENSYSW